MGSVVCEAKVTSKPIEETNGQIIYLTGQMQSYAEELLYRRCGVYQSLLLLFGFNRPIAICSLGIYLDLVTPV